MNNIKLVIVLLLIALVSCTSRDSDNTSADGFVTFDFQHLVEGKTAVFDQLIYENTAGNKYEITNIQWFVSDVTFVTRDGGELVLSGDDWIHYIDTDIPDSHTWVIKEGIPSGDYKAVRFTFGIKGAKNLPNMYSNPPESNMIWPYYMGGDEGGYHYMKLNGFWIDNMGIRKPFNYHIGVGQIYNEEKDITGFIQNWRTIEIPSSSFTLLADETVKLDIKMNIENWFDWKSIYDHNEFGGAIMDNQDAMSKIKDNSAGVFSILVKEEGGDDSIQ